MKNFFRHSRTIFVARLVQLLGFATMIESAVAGQDWTPVLLRLFVNIPSDIRPLAIGATVAVTGAGFEWLRTITTQPLAPK